VKKAAPPAKPKKKPAAADKKLAAAKKPAPTKRMGPRPDLGAPVDGFFAKQPPHTRAILDELRKLVDEAAPEATSSPSRRVIR
jgi:hypothetical protein